MTEKKPARVSIIMPAYNASEFIHPALDSILEQTFGDFELIIINDGSTDDTQAIVESYDDQIRYTTHALGCGNNSKKMGCGHRRKSFMPTVSIHRSTERL